MIDLSHGVYDYWCNGVRSDVRETWASVPGLAGRRQVQATRTAPSFGSTLTVTALMHGQHIESFAVQWRNTSPGAVAQASAHYTLSATHIQVERTLADTPLPPVTLERPPQLVVSPLLRIFQGPAIAQLAARGDGVLSPVLVPWIHDPRQADQLLMPELDQRGAKDLGDDTAWVDDQPVAVRGYAYLSGRYTDKAVFYLTATGLLVHYTFAESADRQWEVRLSQAATAPQQNAHRA